MSGIRNSPKTSRYQAKIEQQHHSWDEASTSKLSILQHQNQKSNCKTPTRAASSPLPYQCPKSPRYQSNSYDKTTPPPTTQPLPAPRSPSSICSTYSTYSDPSIMNRTRSGVTIGSGAASVIYDNPPRSPKITTTYATDNYDDTCSTPSYYQTPTSAISSHENSIDSPLGNIYGSGNHMSSISPHRSPKLPRKFVFDAISPVIDHPNKKLEYYEPISLENYDGTSGGSGIYFEAPMSPKIYEPRRQNSTKLIRNSTVGHDKVQRLYGAGSARASFGVSNGSGGEGGGCPKEMSSKLKLQEWEMPLASNFNDRCTTANQIYIKRDSCVTESTQLSMESNETANSLTGTTTTSFSYSDHSKPERSGISHIPENQRPYAGANKRRHAINITSNPGYQVLHSSHSTLDRTCSDSIVSLRHRKSTSDLTKETDQHDIAKQQKSMTDAATGSNSYKPRRRGSSKGGLAYLANRRNSRESMKNACSTTSIISNDDIGPLAFQATNRGRQRRTSNFLELPVPDHIRPRVCSLPDRPYNPRISDDLYRLRHFSISKGNVVNCGDEIISRRSRSNTSVNSTNSRASERSPFEGSCCGGGYANVDSLPASPDDSENLEPPPPIRYRVVMLGDSGVGKTALVNQFMTSEYMHTYDASLDDEFGEKTVSVLLDDEESELVFIDHPCVEMSVENSLSTYEPHGCVVVFSVVDKSTFRVAEEIINYLWQENYTKDKAVILVGNKADLARSRVITAQDGKALAASRDTKFIETSSGIQHNVDELLVGILKQMRLKETREKKAVASKMKSSRTHISLHLAKEILQKICLSDISKSKSCENLHVL